MIPSEAARIVRELYNVIWNSGELSAVDRLVATQYLIHCHGTSRLRALERRGNTRGRPCVPARDW